MSENEQLNKVHCISTKMLWMLTFSSPLSKVRMEFSSCVSFILVLLHTIPVYLQYYYKYYSIFQNIQNILIQTKTTKHKQCVMLFSATGANALPCHFDSLHSALFNYSVTLAAWDILCSAGFLKMFRDFFAEKNIDINCWDFQSLAKVLVIRREEIEEKSEEIFSIIIFYF